MTDKNDMSLSVADLSRALQSSCPPCVLDVREPHEVDKVPFPGARCIPLSSLQQNYMSLDDTKEWVILCHHGYRSMQATLFLKSNGFNKVRNITGGIDAWSLEVDATVRRY